MKETMEAIIYKRPGVYAYEERPKPTIQNPDDVLIKVLGVGICGTDLHILCLLYTSLLKMK